MLSLFEILFKMGKKLKTNIQKNSKNTIRVLCESYKIKEQIDENTGKVNAVFLEGRAITFGKPTRNGVSYTYESGMQTYKGLIGKPFLDSHRDDSIRDCPPYGHVVNTEMADANGLKVLNYRVDLDPAEEVFIRKAKRGDIPGVSIQVLVDEADEMTAPDGSPIIQAHITEFLELSAVLIPGDGDTTLKFAESFRQEKQTLGGNAVGEIDENEKEELSTNNSDLIGEVLPKKIKKAPEEVTESQIKAANEILKKHKLKLYKNKLLENFKQNKKRRLVKWLRTRNK